MNKIKTNCMAILLAALILLPALGWAQEQVPTTGTPATEPSFFLEGYLGFGSTISSQTERLNYRGFFRGF